MRLCDVMDIGAAVIQSRILGICCSNPDEIRPTHKNGPVWVIKGGYLGEVGEGRSRATWIWPVRFWFDRLTDGSLLVGHIYIFIYIHLSIYISI